jgi:hypothetical protein
MSPHNDAEAAEMSQYPYISIVESLIYLAFTTRPDIAYAAGVLARFNSNPGLPHWQAVKHVLGYLKGIFPPLKQNIFLLLMPPERRSCGCTSLWGSLVMRCLGHLCCGWTISQLLL